MFLSQAVSAPYMPRASTKAFSGVKIESGSGVSHSSEQLIIQNVTGMRIRMRRSDFILRGFIMIPVINYNVKLIPRVKFLGLGPLSSGSQNFQFGAQNATLLIDP